MSGYPHGLSDDGPVLGKEYELRECIMADLKISIAELDSYLQQPEPQSEGLQWQGLARMMYESLFNTHLACFFCGRGVGHKSDCQWDSLNG